MNFRYINNRNVKLMSFDSHRRHLDSTGRSQTSYMVGFCLLSVFARELEASHNESLSSLFPALEPLTSG